MHDFVTGALLWLVRYNDADLGMVGFVILFDLSVSTVDATQPALQHKAVKRSPKTTDHFHSKSSVKV